MAGFTGPSLQRFTGEMTALSRPTGTRPPIETGPPKPYKTAAYHRRSLLLGAGGIALPRLPLGHRGAERARQQRSRRERGG